MYATLALDGDCEAIRIESVQDDYVVILCRVFEPPNLKVALEAAFDGLVGDDAASSTIDAIVIHVPTGRVIQWVCLVEDENAILTLKTYDIPIFFTLNGDMMGTGLWWKGVILTGKDIREVGSNTMHVIEEERQRRSARKQKKKQRLTKRGNSARARVKVCH